MCLLILINQRYSDIYLTFADCTANLIEDHETTDAFGMFHVGEQGRLAHIYICLKKLYFLLNQKTYIKKLPIISGNRCSGNLFSTVGSLSALTLPNLGTTTNLNTSLFVFKIACLYITH